MQNIDYWDMLPPELKTSILAEVFRNGTEDEIIREIKAKRMVNRSFRDLIDHNTPALIEYIAEKFKINNREIATIGYNEYMFGIARKIGSKTTLDWIEQRKKEIPEENKLFHAIAHQDVEVVRKYTTKQINTYHNNATGLSPLSVAIEKFCTPLASPTENQIKIISILLERGANPNAIDCQANRPLHYARWCSDIVRLLLKYGANPNVINRFTATPLNNALTGASSMGLTNMARSIEVIQSLLEAGANPNLQGATSAMETAKFLRRPQLTELIKKYGAK